MKVRRILVIIEIQEFPWAIQMRRSGPPSIHSGKRGVYIEVSPRARPPHGTFTPLFSRIEKRVSFLSIIIFFSPLSPSFHHLSLHFLFWVEKNNRCVFHPVWPAGHFLTGHIPPLPPIGPHLSSLRANWVFSTSTKTLICIFDYLLGAPN